KLRRISPTARAMGRASLMSREGEGFALGPFEQEAVTTTRNANIAPHPVRPISPPLYSLFVLVVLSVVFLFLDDERLLVRFGFLEDFLAGLRFGPFDLFGLLGVLVGVPSEAEEVALDVCPLFRLGRPVMTGERDAARVLRALEDLTNGNASIRLVVTDDRRHVLVSRADQVDEPPPDLRLEESEELAVAGVDRQEALLLAELALSADGVAGEDVARGGIDEPEDAGLAHVLDE